MQNRLGVVAKILDYGGIIRSLEVPDKQGKRDDVVLGFDSIAEYEGTHPYFGAIIGRVAGRIADGQLKLGGASYPLTINDPPNHLHGGINGFDTKLWNSEFVDDSTCLVLSYTSKAGEEGYPAKLQAQVSYQLSDKNELTVTYQATASERTVFNPTQHSYFNLSGDPGQTIQDHRLSIWADKVLELDEEKIPTGRILDVSDTDFDLRMPRNVSEYDDYWVLAATRHGRELSLAVELLHENSGRILQVHTTAPGVQVYSGGGLPAGLVGKGGRTYGPFAGICFETQVHPNSPSLAGFPSIVLEAGETFKSTTTFKFLISE